MPKIDDVLEKNNSELNLSNTFSKIDSSSYEILRRLKEKG